jgi:glycosyltransferase involved in cell wall biosynthesis
VRIAFLNPIGQIGGAERSLLDAMASLREAKPGWKLHLITGEVGPLVEASEALGVKTRVLSLPPALTRLGDWSAHEVGKTALLWRVSTAGMRSARYVASLRALLDELNPNVVHTNGFKMHVLGAWAKPAGVPLVWHVHDYVRPRAVMAKFLRMHAGRCAAVIANSTSVAEDVRAACGGRIRVEKIWNAVDLNEFSPEGARLDLDGVCELPEAGPDVVRFGLVGTLAKWKGHDVFLRALAMLPGGVPIRGYIVGGPVYSTDASQWRLDDLKRMAAGLGLEGKVGFTGFVARPAAAMRALDVVVHASVEPEPFGLVIVEAMACGHAVVVSQAGGAAEFTRDGVNALAHAPGDADRLAELMIRLAQNRGLRERLGAAGRRTAKRDFDRSRLGWQLAPIYESAVIGRAWAA